MPSNDAQSGDVTRKPRPRASNDGVARIENFLDRLSGIATGPGYANRIWSEAANELKYLKYAEKGNVVAPVSDVTPDPRAGKYAISTLRSVLSDYREAVRSDPRFGSDHVVLSYLKPSRADQALAKTIQLQNVVERSGADARRPVDAEVLTDTALALLEAPSPGKGVPIKLVGLVLLTGRRPAELLRGNLEPAGDEMANGAMVRYSGQSRGRDDVAYDIPVLAEPARILAAFRELQREYPLVADLRAAKPDVSDREIGTAINAKTGTRLVGLANEHFADEYGELLGPAELRKAYVAIAFDWYAGGPDGISFNRFAASVLGHSEKDPATALAYQQFEVAGEAVRFGDAFAHANTLSAQVLEAAAVSESGRQQEFTLGHAVQFRTAALRDIGPSGDRASPGVSQSEQTQTDNLASRQGTQLEEREGRDTVVSLDKGDGIMQTTDDEVSLTNEAAPVIVAQEATPAVPAVEASPAIEAVPAAPAIDAVPAVPAIDTTAAAAPVKTERGKDVRNVVGLTGTIESLAAPRSQSAPVKADIRVGKLLIPLAAFREAGIALTQVGVGGRVDVDGYLAIRPTTVTQGSEPITRMITSVTANAVSPADPEAKDRNEAFVRGNTGRDPILIENKDGKTRADVAFVSLAMGVRQETVLFADVVAFGAVAHTLRDQVGQGDAIAVEGKVRLEPGKDSFPASIKVTADDFSIDRKKEPKLELSGRITRDGVQVAAGENKQRVDFTIDTGVENGENGDRYRKVRTFTDLAETWPKTLEPHTRVDVVGKPAIDTPDDPNKKPFEYFKASSVTLAREQVQAVAAPQVVEASAAASEVDLDDLADRALAAQALVEVDVLGSEAAAVATTETEAIASSAAATQSAIADSAQPVTNAIDLDALTNLIVNTDWDQGPEAKAVTLAAITAAAQIDPMETGDLIKRFAAENGAENDPAIGAIIDELKGALNAGVELRLDSMLPKVEQSSLPIFEPGDDMVSDRSAKKIVVDKKLDIFAQSADGAKVFGRDVTGASKEVVAIDRSAFSKTPEVGEFVVSRHSGKDIALPAAPELALGVSD